MESKPDAGFWVRHLAVPFLLFLAAAVFCEVTDADLAVADRFFDFTAGEWPARRAWWAEWLIHKRGKELIIVIAASSLLAGIASWRWQRLRRDRWPLLFLALLIIISTTSVSITKKGIGRHCPWDVTRYGGSVPYTRLSEPPPQACAPGKCFPAGHASGGFALFAGYFAWRDRRRRLALSWLAAGTVLGSIYAYGQMARGAHFLSHNFYSAIICWLIPLVLYLPMRRLLAGRAEGGAFAHLRAQVRRERAGRWQLQSPHSRQRPDPPFGRPLTEEEGFQGADDRAVGTAIPRRSSCGSCRRRQRSSAP